ncbi:MAG TPA: molybdenum cofactor guanylyltransferase MobA [Spongiibacteraceae bacterium]|jgi:molybdenum cofactor guanylyltransferase
MPSTANSEPSDITAVILAGGRSARMGQDKALLMWQQRPFIAHIIERLQAQVGRIAINTNSPQAFADFGLPLIADEFSESRGPLAGIAAALNYSSARLTLIVPCDNPQLSPQLTARLQTAMESENADLAYARSGGDKHYLHALMRSDLRIDLNNFLLANDYAVHRWYATLRSTCAEFDDQPENFRNINRAADLTQLQQ